MPESLVWLCCSVEVTENLAWLCCNVACWKCKRTEVVQTQNWQTVVASVAGLWVPLVGVGVELGRKVVQKVLLLVCYVVGDSSTGQANQLLASRAAWSWPRSHKQINMSINKCGRCSKVKHLNHEITLHAKWHYGQRPWLLCHNMFAKCATKWAGIIVGYRVESEKAAFNHNWCSC